MSNYKPYPFLYKGVPASNKITVSFYVSLPSDKALESPTVNYAAGTNTTTLTYAVTGGSTPRSPILAEKEISWNGNDATVVIVVGTGSGGTGGTATVKTKDFN